MSKHMVRAFIHQMDDKGRRAAPAKRTFAMLCIAASPQILEISIPDKRKTRSTVVNITRKELERVLAQCPQEIEQ